ncbi:lysosome-associated membrane glycoprotein 2 isoform X1 [Alligator mississippiensis]|uniref:lysosome-associated membrane glycoprotein 2 isoform X1 n=1 Tax=Alligator mississippiensis TaxID=8496 RepID=UPI000711A7A2|nr:lysosome-associated membrane glycoprotein 2 isoform X1 [Alligator mississippiensis]
MEPRWSRCGPLRLPRHSLLLLLFCGAGFFQSHAVEVEVKDSSNATCIYAKWMMSFFIKYETNSSEYRNATLHVSPNVTHDGSTCGNETFAPLLAVQFGAGHFWSINFTKTNGTYQGSIITFTYNTNDAAVFQDAKKRGPVTIVVNDTMHPVQLNRVYKCHHNESIEAENVTQSFWDVTLQAFVQNGTVSKNESICDADTPTLAPTSVSPVVNLTTASTTSSPAPTTTPKPVEKPVPGNYSLKNGNQTCFLATMGLQLNASQEKPSVININPKTTHVTGSCGNTSATLKLNDSNSRFIDFVFVVKNTSANTQRFYLKEVNIMLFVSTNGSVLHAENHNLSKWDTSLGSSYMCQKEQTVEVNEDFQIHTFDVRVQPFLVKENKYSTAEDCSLDVDNFIVPIAVGAALGGLVILVLMAYFVGHKKRGNAGYEQF